MVKGGMQMTHCIMEQRMRSGDQSGEAKPDEWLLLPQVLLRRECP